MYFLFLLIIISTHIISYVYPSNSIKEEISTLTARDNFKQGSFLWCIDQLPQEIREKIFFDFIDHQQHASWPEKRSEYIAQFFSHFPRHGMETYFQSIDFVTKAIQEPPLTCLYLKYIPAGFSFFHVFPIVKDALILEQICKTGKKFFSKKELENLDIHLQRSLHVFNLKQNLNIEYTHRQAYTLSNFWQHQSLFQWFLLPAFLWINTINLYKFYEEIQYINEAIVKENHNKELLNTWLQHQFEQTKDMFWINKQESMQDPFEYSHYNTTLFLFLYNITPIIFTEIWFLTYFYNLKKTMIFLQNASFPLLGSIFVSLSGLIGIMGYCFYDQDTPLKSTLFMTGIYAAIVCAINIAKMIQKKKTEITLKVNNFDKENFLKKLLAQKDIVIL